MVRDQENPNLALFLHNLCLGKVHVWADSACYVSDGYPDASDCSELYGHNLTHHNLLKAVLS